MITFKQFLDEEWELERYVSKRTGPRLFTFNHIDIDGHEVRLDINGDANHEFSVAWAIL